MWAYLLLTWCLNYVFGLFWKKLDKKNFSLVCFETNANLLVYEECRFFQNFSLLRCTQQGDQDELLLSSWKCPIISHHQSIFVEANWWMVVKELSLGSQILGLLSMCQKLKTAALKVLVQWAFRFLPICHILILSFVYCNTR